MNILSAELFKDMMVITIVLTIRVQSRAKTEQTQRMKQQYTYLDATRFVSKDRTVYKRVCSAQ